jgi:hypothetical protein
MSPLGYEEKSETARLESALPPAADIPATDFRFRNGPFFVKSSAWYLAAGLVLPSVVGKAAATSCVSDRIREPIY